MSIICIFAFCSTQKQKQYKTIIIYKTNQSFMKKALLLGVIATAAMAFTACTDKKVDAPADDFTMEQLQAEEARCDTIQESGLDLMSSTWSGMVIPVSAGDVNVKTLMRAFCKNYLDFKGNRKMMRYLLDEQGFNAEKDSFTVDAPAGADFMKVATTAELSSATTGKVWTCQDGHKMLGVLMEQFVEAPNRPERVVAFFDFDPSKRELVPNPNVAQKVAKAMDCIYGQLTMVFPVEGNNIEMLEYTDAKDSLSYKIHFDGSSFRFDPKGKKISK